MLERTGAVAVHWQAAYRLLLPEGAPPPRGFPLLLCLHGFGDDGGRLAARLSGLLPAPYALLFPDGPFPLEMREAEDGAERRRVGRAWYQYTGDQGAFLEALAFTGSYLDRVLDHALSEHPLDHERVAVLGYSQGGYLAGVWTLRQHERFRGLVAIACRVKTEVLEDVLPRARGFPVLVVHGERDASVRLAPQEEAIASLRRHGLAVELFRHDGGHGLRPELAAPIDAFARRVLGPAAGPGGGGFR